MKLISVFAVISGNQEEGRGAGSIFRMPGFINAGSNNFDIIKQTDNENF